MTTIQATHLWRMLKYKDETQDAETEYPSLVGCHASTASEDGLLMEKYGSVTIALEHSRFVERSTSDLRALARECRHFRLYQRSEITARLVSAIGRSDPLDQSKMTLLLEVYLNYEHLLVKSTSI